MTAAQAMQNARKLYTGKALTLVGTFLILSYAATLGWRFWNLTGDGRLGADKAALALGLALLHSAQKLAFGGVGILSVLAGMLVLFSPLVLIGFGALLLRQSAASSLPVHTHSSPRLSLRNGGVE